MKSHIRWSFAALCRLLPVAAALAVATASPAYAAVPPNDLFASPTLLGAGPAISVAASNAEATVEAGEPAHAGVTGGASVWYRLELPATSNVTLSTCPAGFNTLLAVYVGGSAATLTEVVANNDDAAIAGSCGAGASRVQFQAIGGVIYYVAVDGAAAATGAFTLAGDVQAPLPPPPPPPPVAPPPPPPVAPPVATPPCPPAGLAVGGVYRGRHQRGGSVCFTVSRDFTKVLSFLVTDVAADTCTYTFGERGFGLGLPISSRAFDLSDGDGTLKGQFHTDRGAVGSFRLLDAGPPACVSPTLLWSASTDATPPWVPDTTRPALTLKATPTQRALRSGTIAVRATCAAQACTAKAAGNVGFAGSGALVRLAGATRPIAADGSVRMTLRLSAAAKRFVRRSLVRRRTVRAKVMVRATDAAGNATTRRVTIRIRR